MSKIVGATITVIVLMWLFNLALVIAAIYIAWHFISKFW